MPRKTARLQLERKRVHSSRPISRLSIQQQRKKGRREIIKNLSPEHAIYSELIVLRAHDTLIRTVGA